MTIDNMIRDVKLQYNINRKEAKTLSIIIR